MNSDSVGPTPATPAGLEIEAQRLEQRVAVLRRQASAGRWVLILSTVLIIAQFAIFCYAMYTKLHSNFSQEAVQKAVSDRGDAVLPLASSLLMETGRNILPDYRAAMVASLHARGPKMANAALMRFEQVPQQSGKVMQDKLATTFDGVMKKIEPDFKKAFPNLSDEERQELVSKFMSDQIAAQNKQIAGHISTLYTNDLAKMQGVLEKFNVGDSGSTQNADAAERDLMHTMVALLDDQLDSTYGDQSMTATTNPTVASTTTQPAK